MYKIREFMTFFILIFTQMIFFIVEEEISDRFYCVFKSY